MTALAIFLLAALFALSASFSASETILFSVTGLQRSRIKARNPAAERRIAACLGDSAILLSTLLVGNTLVNFAIATTGYHLFSGLFPSWGGVAAVPAMTILLLLFGEITPKRIAMKNAERLAPASAAFMLFWRAVFAPVGYPLKIAAKAFEGQSERERRALSDAELVSVIETAAEKGDFAAADAEMISGVLRLSELHANDEMTPRVDIDGYDLDLPESERAAAAAASRHRHLPAFRRTPDSIEGVYDKETGKIEDALFVPEQATLDDLLVTFRKSGKPMAVVADEYGGTAGIITPGDILEIVFGPSALGPCGDEPSIVKDGPSSWTVDARASIDEVNRALGIELEAESADRLAGWIAYHAERIPHAGQHVEADGCRATVLKRRKRRVVSIRLEVLKFPETDTDEKIIAETDEAVERTEEDDA